MAILNPYSKTTYVNGTAPDLNAVNLNKNEQGVYDVTEKVRELAAYETNAAASAVSAASSASSALNSANSAAASAGVYIDLVEEIVDLTTVVANHAKYSTTEEIVIGTFDGKPLYRKAVTIPALGSAVGVTAYAHGIGNIEKIMFNGNSYATSNALYIPIPHSATVLANQIEIYCDSTYLSVSVGKNRSGFSAVIFLEYTKTTD